MFKFITSITLCLVIVNSANASLQAKRVAKEEWWQVSTDNFTVISDEGEEVALELAKNLEIIKNLKFQAVKNLNVALRADPDNVESLVATAQLYAQIGDWGRVVPALESALYVAPSNSSLRKDLIHAYFRAGETELAEQHIDIIKKDAHQSKKSLEAFDKWIKKITEVSGVTSSLKPTLSS